MHNAQQEIKWHEIVNEVMSDPKLNIVKVLLEKGIGINDVNSKGETILLEAAGHRKIDIKVINDLVKAGAGVNAKAEYRTTPLHRAASIGRLDIVKILLGKGADPHARGRRKETALYRAAEEGHVDVVKFLLSQEGVKEKINAVDEKGYTALHLAAPYGHVETTLALLKAGADVNAKDYINEKTPLHTIIDFALLSQETLQRAQRKQRALGVAAQEAAQKVQNAQKVIKILLMYGTDISSKDKHGETLIEQATGDIKLFIEKAANEIKKMQSEKIGTINGKDLSLYEFLKTDDKKQLLLYCSDSSIRNNIHEYLGEHSPIPNERPIYWNDIKGKLHEGIQLDIFETFMTNFLEGGKINDEIKGKTEQLPSIAGAEYVSRLLSKLEKRKN